MMNATATVCIRKLLGPLVVALSLFCIALLSSSPAMAQDPVIDECAGGTLFYIAYPDTITNTYDARYPHQLLNSRSFTLLIYSPVDQQIRIGRANGAGQVEQISEGEIKEFNTEAIGVPIVTVINSPQTNVLKIEAEFPVVVYCYMGTAFGAEAFTAIPVESWGQEYYAATWPGEIVRDVFPAGEFNYRTEPREGQSEILVIAAYDNTQVTIKSTAALRECRGCNSVNLDAGEAYLVQSIVDTSADAEYQGDLAGTEISANKRIAVISGNPRVMHNSGVRPSLAENAFKNMAIEWLPPIEQHGTEFVFMPTWDDRRQREGLDLEESRDAELVRVFGTSKGKTDISYSNELGQAVPTTTTPVQPREFTHEIIGVTVPRAYKTSKPAMAMMSPNAVVKFNGTTTWGQNYVGASYGAWSTYMVELVPREQWISFAPFRAPSWPPTGMDHYLNLVTDTNNQFNVYIQQEGAPRSLFLFNRGRVPGTDLIWGSIPVNVGINYYIYGEKGSEEADPATFFGFVYGSWRGNEQYRPGRNKKDGDDKGSSIAGGGETGDDPEVLHPSEYEEDIALMYGYPLAPSRCVLAPPDEYKIETEMDCEEMTIKIEALNDDPSGIRSITMLPDSSENARLEFITPQNPIDLKASLIDKAELKVVPINPRRNAHAIIIIKDRTKESKRWRVEYTYEAEDAEFDPSDVLDFGEVTINESSGERKVTITNPLDRDLVIKRLSFVFGTQGFVITRTSPEFEWKNGNDEITLASGEKLEVWIEITPTEERRYKDSLKVELGCIELTLPVEAATAQPCIFVNDLNFGTVLVNRESSLNPIKLKISNSGKGTISFVAPYITWNDTRFTIAQADIDNLANVTLGAGEEHTIDVNFTADNQLGPVTENAQIWVSSPAEEGTNCRDISVWKANVVEPGPIIEGYDWEKRWLSENSCTKNPEDKYRTTILAKNEGTTDFEVVSLEIVNDPDNVYTIENPGSIQPGFVVTPNTQYEIQVSFDPKEEKVYYPDPDRAKIVMTVDVEGDISSVEGFLDGIGIESYATITDQDFGKIQFTAAGVNTVSSSVVIEAFGTRPVTITGLTVNPNVDFILDPDNLVALPITLVPGQTQVVDLIFTPQNADALIKNATIDIEGDFAYADCADQSDSSGTLIGEVFTLGAIVEGYDFGTLLTCFEGDGVITVRNVSTEPVQITNFTQAVPGGQGFSVDPDNTVTLPHVLAPAGDANGGDVLEIPVHYRPTGEGTFNATVTITILNEDGSEEVATLVAPLAATAETMVVNMSVARGLTQFPGLPIEIPVMLNDDPARAQVTELLINLDYDEGMMLIRNPQNGGIKLGSLFPANAGWELDINDVEPGSFTVRIYNTAGRYLEGTGEALLLDFITFVGAVTETEIPFNITTVAFGENQTPCIEFTTDPGQVILDHICGLDFRLIEAINGNKYSAGQVSPNVIKTSTTIEFSIGLDAETTIEVFNHNGDKVGVLVDQYLEPGTYSVTWDARNVPSGKYFYRITSGHWSGTNEMLIQK